MSANQISAFTDADLSSEDLGYLRRRPLRENWSFRRTGEHAWRHAVVPGCNHVDLYKSGEIDDPFLGANEKKLQWIEKEDWEYRCRFDLGSEDLDSNIALVFDGLDTYATVLLNGTEVLKADNMFRTYRVSCRQHLKIGDNELVIIFRSPIAENLPKYIANGFTYPAENDKSTERLSVYARKAPYHFGWDWGPRFVSSGIWRDAYLEFSGRGRICNARFQTHGVSSAEAKLSFDIQLHASQAFEGHLSIQCREVDEVCELYPLLVEQGKNRHRVEVTVPNPRLWWPNGLGDAHLYTFSIALFDDNECLDRSEHRVGIRTVEVVNEDDKYGKSFYLKVNGRPVFMKGANYIPSDSFPDRVSQDKYRRVFSDAVHANMNMLRVWGGGIYESDTFYDLADEHGILIWQDFMFACSLYPADKAFLESVKAEAIDNITRLRNHPCLALWCGNNEIAMGIECWDWPGKFDYSQALYARLRDDYNKLFHELLPSLVADEDGERFYMPSSPVGFWEHAEQDGIGNSHFWGVWHGGQDFDEYRRRISRFVTEYGFQSFPILDSVRQFSDNADWDIESEVMQVHQRHPRGNQLILDYLRRCYPEPSTFEHFLYLSQIQQADGLGIAFEAHRGAMPYCMGTLYWQFNDCWPVASWSGIDYYGRWKALHYKARHCFAPIAVFVEGCDSDMNIRIVSDAFDAETACLSMQLINFSGDILWSKEQRYTVQPNKSVVADSIDQQLLLTDRDPTKSVFVVRLVNDSGLISQSNYYFVPTKELALEKPDIRYVVHKTDDGCMIKLTSGTLAKNVYVRLDNFDSSHNLSDNFFDLLPGEEKQIFLSSQGHPVEAGIEIMSMFDVSRRALVSADIERPTQR